MASKNNQFEKKILFAIKQNDMCQKGDHIIVGFSGGADSTCLLLVLDQFKDLLGIDLHAVHINHMIRDTAKRDEDFCRQFCQDRGISFESVCVDIPKMAREEGLTEEEAGRKARYDVFARKEKELGEGSKVAVAHHSDDLAETVLMNLCRGTGLHGITGIRPTRDRIIRPLLYVSRREIEEYLDAHEIAYCTDETNLEDDHTRNRIRHHMLAYASENINEQAAMHIASAARSIAQADEIMFELARQLYQKAVLSEAADEIKIDIDQIQGSRELIQKYLFMICLEQMTPHRKDITAQHFDALCRVVANTDGSEEIHLPYGITACRQYHLLVLSKKTGKSQIESHPKEDGCIRIDRESLGEEPVFIDVPELGRVRLQMLHYQDEMRDRIPDGTYTKWLDCDKIQAFLEFRKRETGDRICIDHAGHSYKTIKKFMIDEKIPAARRDQMYILTDQSDVLWIPGYRISDRAKISKATSNIISIEVLN